MSPQSARTSPVFDVAAHVNTEDLAAISEQLELPNSEIMRLARVSGRTFARRKELCKPLSPSESDRVRLLLQVTEEAERVFGDARRAHAWLKHAHPLLGATPLDLLTTNDGTCRVQQELSRIEWGDFT